MALVDAVSFIAAAAGTGSFTQGGARSSFLTMAQAVTLGTLTNGQVVSYLAQDSLTSPTQREWGHGTFNSAGGGSIARTTVLGSVTGGVASTALVAFTVPPTVSLTALAEDFNLNFNVKNYGATGNGTTDDTAAINSAIAALNTAGAGVLYFPSGTYKVTSALTTITASGTVLGDGMGGDFGVTQAATLIQFTQGTGNLFTTNTKALLFYNFAAQNTSGTTPTAGAGIQVTHGTDGNITVNYDHIAVYGFWINVQVDVGNCWTAIGCLFNNPVQYGMQIQNTILPDHGDPTLIGCWFWAVTNTAAAAIRQLSSGGLKVIGCKINDDIGAHTFTTGIDLAINSATSVLVITGNSIENTNGTTGIRINGTGASFRSITITGNEFLCPLCVSLNTVSQAVISSNVFYNFSGGSNPISVTNCTNVTINANTMHNWAGNNVVNTVSGNVPNFITESGDDAGGGSPLSQTFTCQDNTGFSVVSVVNNNGVYGQLQSLGSTVGGALRQNASGLGGSGKVFICSDANSSSGGSDDIVISPGGNNSETVRFLATGGNVKFSGSANFSANNNVATSLGSIGPTGSHTTVQTWLTIVDNTGATRYIPCF